MTTTSDEIQARITALWNTAGADYDVQPRHGILDERERTVWLDVLRELLPPPPAEILDVGSGTGVLALLMAGLGYHVTGTDLAEGMLATARAAGAALDPRPTFQIGDAQEPDFPDASFDVVTSRHLLWTLTDPERAFAGWLRVLRPGGRVLAIDGLWSEDLRAAERKAAERGEQPKAHTGYSDDVTAALPLHDLTALDPVIEMARAAGFDDVRAVMLDEINAVERAVLPPAEYEASTRYAILGTRS